MQVPGDGVASARSPPGQLVAGSRRRRQYGACTGLHVTSARGIALFLHPGDEVPLARPIRQPPIDRSAARSRAAVGPAAGDGTTPGDELLPTRFTPEVAAISNLDPEIEASPAAPDVLLLFLLPLPNGGTSRPVRVLGPARELLVETLRILIRRCRALPQLVYWLEAAWIGHRSSCAQRQRRKPSQSRSRSHPPLSHRFVRATINSILYSAAGATLLWFAAVALVCDYSKS